MSDRLEHQRVRLPSTMPKGPDGSIAEVRGCRYKRGYRTRTEAKQRAKADSRRAREAIEEYRCEHCGLWHVGHNRYREVS